MTAPPAHLPPGSAATDGTSAAADLRRYLDVLRRRKLFIVEAIVVVALVAGLTSNLRSSRYEATAQILLRPNDPAEQLDPNRVRVQSDPDRYARSQEQIVTSVSVAATAAATLDGVTTDDVQDMLAVGNSAQSDVLNISVRNEDPALARDVANAVALGYLENRRTAAVAGLERAASQIEEQLEPLLTQIAELDSAIGAGSDPTAAAGQPLPSPSAAAGSELPTTAEGLRAARDAAALQYELLYGRLQELRIEAALKQGEAELIEEAQLPDDPVSPRPLRDAALGGSLGLLVAVGYVFLREQLDDKVRAVADVEITTGLVTLAELPFDRESAGTDTLSTVDHPHSPLSEAVRSLRTGITFLGVERPVHTLVVTSAVPGEGKSLVSANIAAAYAQAGLRTVLVSADLRRSGVSRMFSVPSSSLGLTGLIAPRSTAADGNGLGGAAPEPALSGAFVRTKLGRLAFLPAGQSPPNPAELLGSQRMAQLLDELRRTVDMVVIDTPPLLAVTDATVLAAQADGVVLVTALGETRRDGLKRATQVLTHSGARVLGTVVNKTPENASRGYYGSYGPQPPTTGGRHGEGTTPLTSRLRRARSHSETRR